MPNSYRQAVEKAQQDIGGLVTRLEEVRTKIKQLSDTAAQSLGNISQAIAPKDVSRQLKEQTALVTKFNKELKNQKTIINQLVTAQNKQANSLNKTTNALNKTNQAATNLNNKGFKGLVGSAKNLIGAFGILGGTQLIARIVKNTFELTKTLNSLDFAMKAVIKDATELGETEEFLQRITNSYGAELVTTTNRYIKFRAAAQQAGFTAQETQQIFDTMTKVSGVLGLRTDELTGVYLALEQMISKGKITTEELRRQLGERLPGAMDIMAISMNKTTSELDKMMKKGEVITKDVLPGFAEQVEKSFGLQQINRVDTLVAAQLRLQNAWTNFIKDIEGDQGILSSAFTGILDFTTAILTSLTEIDDKLKEAFKSDVLKQQEKTVSALQRRYDKTVNSILRFGDAQSVHSAANVELQNTMEGVRSKIKLLGLETMHQNKLEKMLIETKKEDYFKVLQEEQYWLRNVSNEDKAWLIIMGAKMEALRDVIQLKEDEMAITIESFDRTVDFLRDEIKALKAEQSAVSSSNETWEMYEEQIKEVQDELDEIIGTHKDLDLALKNSERAFEANIKAMKNAASNLDVTGEKYGLVAGLVKLLEMTYKAFTGELDKNKDKTEEAAKNSQKAFDKQIEVFTELRDNAELGGEAWEFYNNIIKMLTGNMKLLKGEFEEVNVFLELWPSLTESFGEFFDIDMSKFEFLFDEMENTVKDWGELSKEVIGSVLDTSLKRYDIELEKARVTRDLILENELASEEEKEDARKRFDEERRRIQTEKAIQERQNVLIKIAVDTAAAVARALAQTGVLAPGVIPGIIAIGAAQASIVASQPLPKYETGTEYAREGLGIIDERRPEVHTDRMGRVKSFGSSKGARISYFERGDKVYRSHQEWLNAQAEDDIRDAVLGLNMSSNGDVLTHELVDRALLGQVSGMRRDLGDMTDSFLKIAKRPVVVKNKVEIKTEESY